MNKEDILSDDILRVSLSLEEGSQIWFLRRATGIIYAYSCVLGKKELIRMLREFK